MSRQTKIEWTEKTWNPVVGCTKVSAGCTNCYAIRQAFRCAKMGIKHYNGITRIEGAKPNWSGVVQPVAHKLDEPLHWSKPKMIFVNSMSDLYHEYLSESVIVKIAAVMAEANWHTYQVLTKRSARLRDLLNSTLQFVAGFPHIWWGVSVENRKQGLPRIEHLRSANAAVRFLSIEPLIEDLGELDLRGIDWVIIGGESGPGARPFDLAWARSILRQCRKARVACFLKQLGACPLEGGTKVKLHDRKGGDWNEWAQDLRVREYPSLLRRDNETAVRNLIFDDSNPKAGDHQMKSKAQSRNTKPLDVNRLKRDLQTILNELTSASTKDSYSPKMWLRLQTAVDYVVTAINAVRMRLDGKTAAEVATELGLSPQQVAAYLAWNTMYQPEWPARNRLRKLKEAHR